MRRWLLAAPLALSLLVLWPVLPVHGTPPAGLRTKLFTGSGYVWVYADGATVPVNPSHKPSITAPLPYWRGAPSGSVPAVLPVLAFVAVALLALGLVSLRLAQEESRGSGPGLARGPPSLPALL